MTARISVLFISTSYPANGEDWRGVFIARLVDSLARQPRLSLKVWSPPGEMPSIVRYVCNDREEQWLKRLMELGGIAHLLRQSRVHGLNSARELLSLLRSLYRRETAGVDVLHVNWMQNLLPLGRGNQPVLVTVLGSDLQLLKMPGMCWMLRRVLRGRRSLIAPNAEWMVEPLSKCFGDVAEIRPVVFGIGREWYALERDWNHPRKKWLVVLRLTSKKIGGLFSWGESLFSETHRELHLFGPMQDKMEIPEWVHYHGPSNPQELQAVWFPQAAGLLTLSQHNEGRPQVILEAMAAGLPVIASNIPAHRSLLEHQQTGWLCDESADLREAITRLENKADNEEMGGRARQWVRESAGTWDDCAQRYRAAYESLMAPAE